MLLQKLRTIAIIYVTVRSNPFTRGEMLCLSSDRFKNNNPYKFFYFSQEDSLLYFKINSLIPWSCLSFLTDSFIAVTIKNWIWLQCSLRSSWSVCKWSWDSLYGWIILNSFNFIYLQIKFFVLQVPYSYITCENKQYKLNKLNVIEFCLFIPFSIATI